MPKEIKNLDRVARRIKRAVKRKERIIIYGDADLDGLASVIILKESIKSLGGEVDTVCFSEHQKGDNNSLLWLKKKAPAILIFLDRGVSNFNEVGEANKLGLEVVIIDHHEILGKLPKAAIIVDPKQKGDSYPFKLLANSGIVFRLSKLLFGRKFSRKLKESFLELVAISTVADMVPRKKDNKVLISKGLGCLGQTFRPGLRVFWEMAEEKGWTPEMVQQNMISALNFSEVKNHLSEAYLLLIAKNEEAAETILKDIIEKNDCRRQKVKEIAEEAGIEIEKKPEEPIVFESSNKWETALLGSVASKVCQKYKKPTFILAKGKGRSRGSLRMPGSFNGVEAMKTCSQYLLDYGGHPAAAGFTIKNKNVKGFKNCLIGYFKQKI